MSTRDLSFYVHTVKCGYGLDDRGVALLKLNIKSYLKRIWYEIMDWIYLGNGSVNTFPRQRIHSDRRTVQLFEAVFSVWSVFYQILSM
jgi:hypothetical protein